MNGFAFLGRFDIRLDCAFVNEMMTRSTNDTGAHFKGTMICLGIFESVLLTALTGLATFSS